LAARAAGLRCVVIPNDLTRAMDLREADAHAASLAAVSLDALLRPPGRS
jgi:beta-phosphoglucomutase-like phosphatase (HAD superfamily)